MRRSCVPRTSASTVAAAASAMGVSSSSASATPPTTSSCSSHLTSSSALFNSAMSSPTFCPLSATSLSAASPLKRFGSCSGGSIRGNAPQQQQSCCSSTASSHLSQQRRALSFETSCETKVFNVDPPRHVEPGVRMHPMVRKFVDGCLTAEMTSLVYNEVEKKAEKADGSAPTPLPAPIAAGEAADEEADTKKKGGKKAAKGGGGGYMGPYDESIELSDAVAGPLHTGNLLLSGMEGTGKRTNLILAGTELEAAGKRVAWVCGDFFRVHSMGAIYMHYYLGLRVGDGLPIMEQMVGMFRRHAIILETTFEKLIPSLLSTDVLIFDSIQHANANMLRAMDRVCREIRQQPNLPFGGIRILAAANFWRLLRVSPASEYSGYTFQLPEMDKWFDHFYLTNVHHQEDALLKLLTHKATLGELTVQDCKALEERSCAAKSHPMAPTPMVDYAPALRVLQPAMAKHVSKRILPAKITHLRRTDFGNFLANILGGPFTYSNTFMLAEKATFEPGTPVHLVHATDTVPAGEHGIVESVSDATIVVNFPRLRQSVPIPICRFRTYHVDYPEVAITTLQFPLQNRTVTSGKFLVHGERYWNIQIDGLYLTETNHLGLFLNKMRSFADFQATNMDKFLRLEGMVHEATRVYCRELMACGRSDTQIVMKGDEWCRNCKSHVPAAEFFTHWRTCLKQLRWCSDCNRAIPLSKYASHREKHQIVLCIDCAMPIEWRNWELHRLTCAPMMREISSENELLPERTRQVAMQYGLDRRDLHTVKRILKSNLPNAKGAKRTNKKVKALSEVHTGNSTTMTNASRDLGAIRPV